MKRYIHYGCGLCAPKEWQNFDISPTLRIQKIPVIGKPILKVFHPVFFPDEVQYGNIIKGLKGVKENSCDGAYCSHTLEHLSLKDFRKAIKNTYDILKPGGIFRCVVPDLEIFARDYVKGLNNEDADASMQFMNESILGTKNRPTGFRAVTQVILGNSNHLWMWDKISLQKELKAIGFKSVRACEFNDSSDEMFRLVEEENRFKRAAAVEAIK